MLYYLGNYIQQFWGPARLLTSNAVLIAFVVYLGFFASRFLIPAFYKFMPHDRGREFTVNAEQAKGKPTGTGSIFITFFVIICFLFIPMNIYQMIIVGITWITMLTGFFDDRSTKSWGEYRKALLDLIIAVGTSFVLYYCSKSSSDDGIVYFWLPFFANPVKINMAVYI
ncbi:MAG: phospho-N-acetylmuramoyl-pentapeptide-transferase, partial [Treponema sp.]|nr:phospho-N-acetylmuramoyl-pentapeptide-transferase [Treponema sp.]